MDLILTLFVAALLFSKVARAGFIVGVIEGLMGKK